MADKAQNYENKSMQQLKTEAEQRGVQYDPDADEAELRQVLRDEDTRQKGARS